MRFLAAFLLVVLCMGSAQARSADGDAAPAPASAAQPESPGGGELVPGVEVNGSNGSRSEAKAAARALAPARRAPVREQAPAPSEALRDEVERFAAGEVRRQGELNRAELRADVLAARADMEQARTGMRHEAQVSAQELLLLRAELAREKELFSLRAAMQDRMLHLWMGVLAFVVLAVSAVPVFYSLRAGRQAERHAREAREALSRLEAAYRAVGQGYAAVLALRADRPLDLVERDGVRAVAALPDAPREAASAARSMQALDEGRLLEAVDAAEVLVREKPGDFTVAFNAGVARNRAALAVAGEERRMHLHNGARHFQSALAVRPGDPAALNNRAGMLLGLAQEEPDPDRALAFLNEALNDYDACLARRPRDPGTLGNRGGLLMEMARRQGQEEREPLFARALADLGLAESLRPGSAAYDLACLAALRGLDEECMSWLRIARERRWPGCEHFLADADFSLLRTGEPFEKYRRFEGDLCPQAR